MCVYKYIEREKREMSIQESIHVSLSPRQTGIPKRVEKRRLFRVSLIFTSRDILAVLAACVLSVSCLESGIAWLACRHDDDASNEQPSAPYDYIETQQGIHKRLGGMERARRARTAMMAIFFLFISFLSGATPKHFTVFVADPFSMLLICMFLRLSLSFPSFFPFSFAFGHSA